MRDANEGNVPWNNFSRDCEYYKTLFKKTTVQPWKWRSVYGAHIFANFCSMFPRRPASPSRARRDWYRALNHTPIIFSSTIVTIVYIEHTAPTYIRALMSSYVPQFIIINKSEHRILLHHVSRLLWAKIRRDRSSHLSI